MPLYQAVALAIVQAATEFLPISSTAHLALVPWLLKWRDPGLTFDVALHAGTLVAVIVYFWREWRAMLGAVAGRKSSNPELGYDRRLLAYLLFATVPGAVVGYHFRGAIEYDLRNPMVMGVALIVVAVLMGMGEKFSAHERSVSELTLRDAVLIGLAQAIALIPGVSRSGITMTAGLLLGLKRPASARFSFLLSTPIIAGAATLKGLEVLRTGLPEAMILPFVVGTAVAGFAAYIVIAWLLRYLATNTFKIFIVYRIVLGVIVLALGWGWRHA
jgi:undecaprenyl-diphosphatase